MTRGRHEIGAEGGKGGALEAMKRPIDAMGDRLAVPVLWRAFDARVEVPGSKSLTNRAILLAALAGGESVLRGVLRGADDAERMIEAVTRLGAVCRSEDGGGAGDETARRGGALFVEGVGGCWEVGEGEEIRLELNNAGTATRFLAATAALSEPASRGVVIDGNARMRQRPIGELVGMLRAIGITVEELGEAGCVPIRVLPVRREVLAREVRVGRTMSSQYVSALLLAAPFLPGGLRVVFEGALTSASYVSMTVGLLRRVGVRVDGGVDRGEVRVWPAHLGSGEHAVPCLLEPFELEIEPDASAATYFWAAAALTPGARCFTPGIGSASLQGDAGFAAVLGRMGALVETDGRGTAVWGTGTLRGVHADMSDMPDAAMTLAVVCCFAEGESVLTGLRTLRVKETDRIAALRHELEKLGARVSVFSTGEGEDRDEGMRITPARPVWPRGFLGVGDGDGLRGSAEETGRGERAGRGAERLPVEKGCAGEWGADADGFGTIEFETYDDHRMAMALALAGLRRPGVVILDPGCVRKTFPEFWGVLAGVYERSVAE